MCIIAFFNLLVCLLTYWFVKIQQHIAAGKKVTARVQRKFLAKARVGLKKNSILLTCSIKLPRRMRRTALQVLQMI